MLRERVATLAHQRVGQGPPLALLHPLGTDRHVWDPVVPLLRDQRELILIDLPGFGRSAPLADVIPTPSQLAAAVAQLLWELELMPSEVHVAGNSLGGWAALELGLAGQAASVTAIAPAGLWPRPLAPKPETARRIARTLAPGLGAAMRSSRVRRLALSGSVADPALIPPDEAAAMVRAYAGAPGFSAVNRAMRGNVFTGLDQIKVPVTLAWPEHDRLIARPASVPRGVSEACLKGCGHIPMWDDPQAVAAVLLNGSVDP